MTFTITESEWRSLFPRAPQKIITAFANHSEPLEEAGILETRTRIAYALANVEHECGGFTISNLTENIRYSAERMAEVWPSRFSSAAVVRARFGTGSGWRHRAFDEIYGNRMGNRPGTSDGSRYIGRGGPQVTGRDGYRHVGKRAGLNLVDNPELATLPEHQPAILAAFWDWKGLNRHADNGDFLACVKAWNGGTNGLQDRIDLMKGNDPIVRRLSNVTSILPVLDHIGGGMPPPAPVAPAQPSAAELH